MAITPGAYRGAATGRPQIDVFLPEIWSSEILRQRDANFVVAQNLKKIPMVGKKGDLVHIPKISRLAINDKVYNTPVTLQTRTETEYTIIVDKYKETSFMIEDIVGIQSAYNLRAEYTREAGYAIAQDIDNFALGLRADLQGFNGQSNVVYNTDTGAAGGTYLALNEASILTANQILDEALVPMEGRRLIISPGQKADLMTIERFTSIDYVNSKPIMTGQIGSIYGIPIMVSNNLKANSTAGYTNGTGGTPQPTPGVTGSPYWPSQANSDTTATTLPVNTTTAMLMHPDWAIMAMQMNPKTESSRENLYQADAVVSTQIYGMKSYRLDHAILIHTAS